ncbi:hypothetical protein D3C81_1906540 [compost metagenome]
METRPRSVPAGIGEHQPARRQRRRQRQHQGRQPIRHQGDAKGRRPGAEVVDARRVVARRSADRRFVQQGIGHADQGDQGAQADQGLQAIALFLEQQHARRRD